MAFSGAFFGAIGVAACALASVAAEIPADREAEIEAARLSSITQWEKYVTRRLIDSSPIEGTENSISFIYVRAFESQSLIRLDAFPATKYELADGSEDVDGPYATLLVAERRDREQPKVSQDQALHTVTTIDSYYGEIATDDFQGVRDAIEAAGFLGLPDIGPRNSCLDGNFYIMVVATSQSKHRVYRHVCDENYAADIQSMQPLFDLVRKEAPEAVKLTESYWQEISARHQR
ncbi:MAG: hypothetical protein R3C55_11530 [Parvularculaceae bacterium]